MSDDDEPCNQLLTTMVPEVFLEIFLERESEPRNGEERQKNLRKISRKTSGTRVITNLHSGTFFNLFMAFSIPSFFLFPSPPTFRVPFSFASSSLSESLGKASI